MARYIKRNHFVTRAKLFLISLLLSGCGGGAYVVSGSVEVNHNINLDIVEEYFIRYCQDLYPFDVWKQQECVDLEMVNFIKMLENMK